MADPTGLGAEQSGPPADAAQDLGQMLTEAIRQAAVIDISCARVATKMSGALLFPGTVLPTRSGALTEEERTALFQALEH